MKIIPIELENQDKFIKEVLHWRKTKHEFEVPIKLVGKSGIEVRTVFCGKCGMSSNYSIHKND